VIVMVMGVLVVSVRVLARSACGVAVDARLWREGRPTECHHQTEPAHHQIEHVVVAVRD
jgi:hypothetical protein